MSAFAGLVELGIAEVQPLAVGLTPYLERTYGH